MPDIDPTIGTPTWGPFGSPVRFRTSTVEGVAYLAILSGPELDLRGAGELVLDGEVLLADFCRPRCAVFRLPRPGEYYVEVAGWRTSIHMGGFAPSSTPAWEC